ncbi:hypothetical protein C8F04DRAFT_1314317 [Mycena alexandri]|uniref:Ubiquitin-like domain-containing protein n=1 Tax=Mycena alexandri TaxID=1745969 RepID=A0AAD6S5D8_9AGAR|nr:hypothetical protein C8F04DRAFT_1314317 [Mycena alexandri]
MSTTTVEMPPRPGFIRVKIQYGEHYQLFDMNSTRTLGGAMRRFAVKIKHELAFLRFHYDETRVEEGDTPTSLGMDERDTVGGNIIDVYLMQIGGGVSCVC